VYDFDVLVIGSGPGGQKAAIAAAKLERRVAIIEGRDYPTLAEGYKVAGLDAMNKMRQIARFS
jgi:pyruvate/2-oxoglutarate dehydrogenase complex dihydrolipoamide dehydrogenase (E3) component